MLRKHKPSGHSFELLPGNPTYYLEKVIEALNPTIVKSRRGEDEHARPLPPSAMQIHLRLLVKEWKESGPNLQKMLKLHPEIDAWVNRGTTLLLKSEGAQGYLDWVPPKTNERDAVDREGAMEYFLWLIVNPAWKLLGGPCPKCGAYFLKNNLRQTVYCSRKCSGAFTAKDAMRKQRERKREKTIRNVLWAIEEYSKQTRKLDWKQWIASKRWATKHWLTRAVKQGWIQEPSTKHHS